MPPLVFTHQKRRAAWRHHNGIGRGSELDQQVQNAAAREPGDHETIEGLICDTAVDLRAPTIVDVNMPHVELWLSAIDIRSPDRLERDAIHRSRIAVLEALDEQVVTHASRLAAVTPKDLGDLPTHRATKMRTASLSKISYSALHDEASAPAATPRREPGTARPIT